MNGVACHSNALPPARNRLSQGPSRQWPGHVPALPLRGRGDGTYEMKAPSSDQSVQLAVLGAVASAACGLASIRGDLLFVAVFGAASLVTIIEAVRRLP